MRSPMPPGRDEHDLALTLDALCAPAQARAQARAKLAAQPGGAERRERLEHELGRVAEALRADACRSARRERAWIDGLLARTTRQDLSWRGDLRLALEFLRARLRSSPALRLVAASLVLHVLAAPVVAYWILREPVAERRLTLRVEQPADVPFAAEPPRVPALDDELTLLARQREARENARARERFVLARCAAPALVEELPAGAPPELVLLAARARELRAQGAPADALPYAWSELEPLALALWVELALDRWVTSGVTAPELGPACARALVLAADPALAARAPGAAALLRAAAGRAAGLGFVEDGTAAARLLAPDWFEALALAGAERGLAESPVWRAWLAADAR